MLKISSVVINNKNVNKQNMIASATDTNEMINAIKYLSYSLHITKIVVITISGYAGTCKRTNTLQTDHVKDLIKNFSWK